MFFPPRLDRSVLKSWYFGYSRLFCALTQFCWGDLEQLLVLTGSPAWHRRHAQAGVRAGSLSCLWLHASFCCGFAAGASLVTSSRMVHRGVLESIGKTCLSFQKGLFCSEDTLWGGEENIFLSKQTWTHSGQSTKYTLCV